MQSWHFEGKAAEEMFRQEQREQEDREKKRAEKDKPFGLLARMKASGWEPGQQLPAVDGIESDHTIDFTVIPIAKPLEWLVKPLVGLIRAQWLGRVWGRDVAEKVVPVLEGAVKSNYGRFVSKVPANAKASASFQVVDNGNYLFQAISPGKVPGSSAVCQKWVNPQGETFKMIKTTFSPDGEIIHVKPKF